MPKSSSAYWAKRAEQLAGREHAKADRYVADMTRDYERAAASIRQDIEAFYGRYAANNNVTMAEARRQLDARELKDFRMTLDEFREKHLSGQFQREVENASIRVRLSRLEALELQMRGRVDELKTKHTDGIGQLLGDVYDDRYHRGIYEIQHELGFGHHFATLDQSAINRAVREPWEGGSFSTRLWKDTEKLGREIHTTLMQGLIRGDSIDRMTRVLSESMKASQSRCARIVRTEVAHVTESATLAGYGETDVEKYQILATLDNRTSDICAGLDGEIFKTSEAEEGVNYPPFHPNCRTTTVAFFDDEATDGTRVARGEDGESYDVPADMTYKQWREKYVDKPTSTVPPNSGTPPAEAKFTRSRIASYAFSNGTSSGAAVTTDAFVYAQDGFSVVRPAAVDLTRQTIAPEEVLKIHETLPQALQDAIDVVELVDYQNPQDAYWATRYGIPNFSSAAVGGHRKVTFFENGYSVSFDWLTQTMQHEYAHNLDGQYVSGGLSSSQAYYEAKVRDDIVNGGAFPSEYARQAFAASYTLGEDFADGASAYLTDADAFRIMYPNRTSLIEEALRWRK